MEYIKVLIKTDGISNQIFIGKKNIIISEIITFKSQINT